MQVENMLPQVLKPSDNLRQMQKQSPFDPFANLRPVDNVQQQNQPPFDPTAVLKPIDNIQQQKQPPFDATAVLKPIDNIQQQKQLPFETSAALKPVDNIQQQKQSPFSPWDRTIDPSLIALNPITADDSAVDLGNDSHDLLDLDTPAKLDGPNHASNSLNATNEKSASPAASAKSTSPESGRGSVNLSPEMPIEPPKKRKRTNYTPVQIRTLEKTFSIHKYPDAEMMERLSVDVGIDESKLKIWFQNKRARCRRGRSSPANAPNNPNQFSPNPFMPMSPVLSSGPMGPFTQHNNMMGPTPQCLMSPLSQNFGGYFNYPGMPGMPGMPGTMNQTTDQMAFGNGNKQTAPNMSQNPSRQFPGLPTPYPPMPALSSVSNSPMSYSQSQMNQQQPRNFQFPSLSYP